MSDRNRPEVRDFLASRRARISPQQAGLTTFGHRRVPGLRREEVATLAGVSAEYYARLERGNLTGTSDSVLDAVARALQLDEAERAHLFDLARAANASPASRVRRPAPQRIRPGVQQLLDAMTGVAAVVGNGRGDTLAANRLGRALFAPVFDGPARGNGARFTFLDPRSVDFYPDWEQGAHSIVAALRGEAGRNPDKGLTDLIGELATHSDTFRTLWAAHDVRLHRTGTKRIHHPVVGDMTLAYEVMALTADDGLALNAFTAEPGSASADALGLLASWAATLDRPTTDTERAREHHNG
ncbi:MULTISPECIES: helix-turn-helix transcriptional regulator [unclassified Geodermatophilus]|uniref:helix-turn-helix transcriptional regulator n=1 Tax=unclassified Geodermatophilus TaxID=2637632 RepID=UPI003EE962D2